jgi:DNA-binding PadR family transcriptional regulator
MEENEKTYHAVEKDGVVTAIWEMQGRKHLRTIDPRSEEGRRILGSHTIEESEQQPQAHSAQEGL